MKWTAYFHPQFVEELGVLPPDLRIVLYAQLMVQCARGPLAPEMDRHHPADPGKLLTLTTKFQSLGVAPKFHAAFDTKIMRDSFIYLHLARDAAPDFEKDGDKSLVEKTAERLRLLGSVEADLVNFDDHFSAAAPDERNAAYGINADRDRRGLHNAFLQKALQEAGADCAALLNLSAPQLDRMITRLDFYLKLLDEKLSDKGGRIVLSASFTGSEDFESRTLRGLFKKD